MKERIGYYDLARGLGIIFVVIGHIDTFYVPFRSVVITFHMALFFMISGMLFLESAQEEKRYAEVVKKKFVGIMVPYIFFSVLSFGIEFVRLALQGVFYWPHFKALLISAVSLYGNSVMWFLPALFFSELAFLTIRRVKNDFVTVLSVFGLTVLTVWANTFEPKGPEILQEFYAALIRGVYCTVFVCIGYYVRKYIFTRKIPTYIYGGIGIVLLAISTKMNDINPKVDLRAMKWGEIGFSTQSEAMLVIYPAFLYLAGAVSGALGILFLCKLLDRYNGRLVNRVIMFFGCNSLIVMATHLDLHVLHYSMDLATLINNIMPNSILYHTCILLLVFLTETVLIKFINRYIPVLTGKYK